MSEFDDSRSEQADNTFVEGSAGEIESLTSAFADPAPSPLDDLPPASYWPDGAVPTPRPRVGSESDLGSSDPLVEDGDIDNSASEPADMFEPHTMLESDPVPAPTADELTELPPPAIQSPPPPPAAVEAAPFPPPAPAVPPYQPGPPVFDGQSEGRSRRTLWIILGVIAAAVICLGGCGVLLFRSFGQPPIDRANELMAEVVSGDFAGAARLASTDSQCFGTDAEEAIAALFVPNPVAGYNFTFVSMENSASIEDSSVENSAFVEGSIDFEAGAEGMPEGGSRPARIILVETADDWQVCGIFVE